MVIIGDVNVLNDIVAVKDKNYPSRTLTIDEYERAKVDSLSVIMDPNDRSMLVTTRNEGSGVVSLDTNVRGIPTVKVVYQDSSNLDAQQRLRMSAPHSLFDSKQVYNDQPLFWTERIVGSGEVQYDQQNARSRLIVGTDTGDEVTRQTKEYFIYQPGKSLLIGITSKFSDAKENVLQQVSYGDDNNGLIVEIDSFQPKIVHRTDTSGSVVDTAINRENWDDPLDGTGESGIDLDFYKVILWVFDMEWSGRVRIGIMTDGEIIYCHKFNNFNILETVFLRTPNLPLRFSIRNTGNTASPTCMTHIGGAIISEGGYNPIGVTRSASTELTTRSVGSVYFPVISIRLKDEYCRAQIIPTVTKIYNQSNTMVHAKLVLNPTLTDPSWTSAGDNAIAEYDISATAVSGGYEFMEDTFVSSQGSDRNQLEATITQNLLKVLSDIDGNSDIISIIAQSDGAASNVHATITFMEIY